MSAFVKIMQRVINSLYSYKNESRSPAAIDDDHVCLSEFHASWRACFPNKTDRDASEARARYAGILDYVGKEDVEGRAGMRFLQDEKTIVYTPSAFDPNAIFIELQAATSVMRTAWRQTDELACVVLDFREVTHAIILRLMHASTSADVRTGLDLWSSIPCRIKKIEVRPPRHLVGWWAVSSVGLRFLSPKMAKRVQILKE